MEIRRGSGRNRAVGRPGRVAAGGLSRSAPLPARTAQAMPSLTPMLTVPLMAQASASRASDHAWPCCGAIEFIGGGYQASPKEMDKAQGTRNGLQPANLAKYGLNGGGSC